MKSYRWLILSIISCLILASGAAFWSNTLINSIYAYRSPLHNHPPAPGKPLGNPLSHRVVFILVDALREDTSLKSDVMPFLNELRQKGAWATMHSRPPSYSEPGYTVLLTGAWPDVSDGPTINLDYANIPTFTQDDLVSAIHRAGMKTAISGYYWFEKLVPQSSVDTSFYTPGEDMKADAEVVNAAIPWLKDDKFQFVLIHLDQVDYAGHHEGGPIDPRWNAAASRVDNMIREVASTLDLTQDTLFICSDHGQIDRGGHGGQDPITLIEPFVLVGAGVKPGHYSDTYMVDVAPTLAALLGANIPASSQGHVRTEMLVLKPDQLNIINIALEAQQSQILSAYQSAIGQNKAVQPANDIVSSYQSALDAARAARLDTERLPRLILALIIVCLPAGVLILKRGREVSWLLVGAVLYLIILNFRYAVLDHRTYSLSSVTGASDLIFYCVATAGIAQVIAWLLVLIGLRTYRRKILQASELSLGLTFTTIYLLFIPVMYSFWLNGAIVTWTLPDFASSFLAFLSLIQILLISIIGLLLAVLSGLITKLPR